MTGAVDNEAVHAAARILWSFLAPSTVRLPASDAIFVFGGNDLQVPRHAAALFHLRIAPIVLVSGSFGPFSQDRFTEPEAVTFGKELREMGVPDDAIVLETGAKNTGENVRLGMAALLERIPAVRQLVLVSKPFLMRRCLATFEQQFPSIVTLPSPPSGDFEAFVDRPMADFVLRLVAEVDRLEAYVAQGFIAPVPLPVDVRDASRIIRASAATSI